MKKDLQEMQSLLETHIQSETQKVVLSNPNCSGALYRKLVYTKKKDKRQVLFSAGKIYTKTSIS